MRVAAIDIGTNSIRLLKAEIIDGQLKSGNKALEMTRIGEGVNETGELSEAGMARSVKALKEFYEEAKTWGAQRVYALATSAVRDAQNRETFIKRVKEACGLDIEVISGDQEAKIGFLGVLAGVGSVEGKILVIDVGGGSTELIVGDSQGITLAKSVNVGAVRMTGKHIKTDPITDSEYLAVKKDIEDITRSVLDEIKAYKITKAIGIGGTATTLGAIELEMETYDRYKIQNTAVTGKDIQNMNERLRKLNLEDRKQIKGLQPKRADIILAGSMVIDHILDTLQIDAMHISDFDNLEGCLMERLILDKK
ncbi:Ppx/GppA family phosphatase [Fusibacter sp. JL216-2]|uniref:Ppx/GppA phosphatase family protein n=1 Tax=Fusibacter sp. JL216-2 TaxID=3071453 RepID=UPI003D33144A